MGRNRVLFGIVGQQAWPTSISSRLFFRPRHGSRRPHWLAGVRGLELRNPCASDVFEMS
jgi:hypothetical protein